MTLAENIKNETLPPPAPPGLRYRAYQVEAICFARERRNVLIADQMGTGKTISTVGIINDDPSIRKVLIVCPASLKINWARELLKWLVRREVTLGIAHPRRGFPLSDIVIINYENLKTFHRNIHATEWDLIVADEAHYLKNPRARRTQEIMGYQHKDPIKRRPKLEARRVVFLTGTPIVNRPSELWPLLHYLDTEEFPDRVAFLSEFCGGSNRAQNKSEIGEESLHKLHDKLRSTVMIRRLKQDVLPELPPKIRQVIVLPADSVRHAVAAERKRYDQVQQGLSVIRMKAELAKMVQDDEIYRQAVAELKQAEFASIQQITAMRMQTAMAKIPLAADHIKYLLEHVNKVLVFAHHTAVIENLANEFGEAVVTVHGSTSLERRQRNVDRFQNDPSCRVYIGGLKASGEGITLTRAQVVCFCELGWTPSELNQCEDRSHRMGQQGNVLVQHLVLDGSIDAMMAHRLVEKQDTINTALDADAEVESLYSLSRATPFVEESRDQVLEIASKLSDTQIDQIHNSLTLVARRGRTSNMSDLDYNIMKMLADLDYLEPTQAALGLTMLSKHTNDT